MDIALSLSTFDSTTQAPLMLGGVLILSGETLGIFFRHRLAQGLQVPPMMFQRPITFLFSLGFVLLLPWVSHGATVIPRHQEPNYQSICEAHARNLENLFDLPKGLLTAINRVETGRPNGKGLRLGWPWAINDNGKGLFFDNKDDMLAYARAQLDQGNDRMDIGCMQINVYWHRDQFTDIDDIADPSSNIAYAAAFLSDLRDQHGSIDDAIRHYHNADYKQSTPYLARVYEAWEQVVTNSDLVVASAPISIEHLPNTASFRNSDPQPVQPKPSAAPIKVSLVKKPIITVEPKTNTVAAPSPVLPSPVMVESDPLSALKARQPHLRGKWDQVKKFRLLLNPN